MVNFYIFFINKKIDFKIWVSYKSGQHWNQSPCQTKKTHLINSLANTVAKMGNHAHTRIPDGSLGVHGGCWFIPDDKYVEFYNLYVNKVFANKKQEYLTEKQNDNGPLLIDLDFRYSVDIDERQHKEEDVDSFIQMLFEKIEKVFNVENDTQISVYVFEKDNVNALENVTKDGIHIMTDLGMDVTCKNLIRNMMIEELPKIWNHLPIINTWSDVVDEAVICGKNNWQMIGSRKPGHEAYKMVNQYKCKFINNIEGWNLEEIEEEFDYHENYYCLSCRSMQTVKLDFLIQKSNHNMTICLI